MSQRGRTSLKTGSRVEYSVVINGQRKLVPGQIVYGPGPFHLKPNENDWCGVVLDHPYGKNNGTIQGRQYFECPDGHGVFVRVSTLKPESRLSAGSRSRSTTPSTTPTMTPSSSITSFTGMFDSGSSSQQPPSGKMSESVNLPPGGGSKLRPPTNIPSSSSAGEIVSKIPPAPSRENLSNIRQMVEKIEIKRDEKLREDDAAHDISEKQMSPSHKASVSLGAAGAAATNSKEVEELQDKVKDLESKLQTLMVKRAEDRQKFKEFERLRVAHDQLVENKRLMVDKIAELSRAKENAEREAQEAREEKIRQADEIKDLVENAEMTVMDKELAEEKAEQLQQELEDVKQQLEEAKVDFDLLKSEIEDKGVDGAASSFQVKQLEEQNARYREALIKLRDISATERSNNQLLQKEVELKSSEIAQLTQEKQKTTVELAKCYEEIEFLKEQVDIAMGSQEMVERLTEKNLEMEDKVEELQKALDEEENIKELSNMILEEKDEIIADLRDEVDRYKTNLFNLRNTYHASQEMVQDHESTIKKFRELVTVLREENTMLRTAQQQDLSKVQHAADVQKQLDNIQFQTRLLGRRDLGRAIDMELRQLDVDQCYRHMVYLARFFPDSFFGRGGDHDAIAVLLFVPRIFAKCSIIERQVLEKYQANQSEVATPESVVREVFASDEGGSFQVESLDKLKQQIFSKHILYLLCSIRSTLDKYQEVLSRCDSELYMKLASLFPELSAHEKSVDHYVDLLREDKLDETVALDSLEKTLSYLQSLYNIYMASPESGTTSTSTSLEAENHNKLLNDLLDVLRTGTEASILDLKIMSQLLNSDASMVISTLETSLNDIDQFGRKIRRRMVSAGSGSSDSNPACLVRFPQQVEAELLDSLHNLSLTVRCLKTVRASIMANFINQVIRSSQQSNETTESSDGSMLARVSKDELEQTCKELTGNSLKALGEMLQNVMSCICKFCTILQQGDYDVPRGSASDTSGDSLSSASLQHLSQPASFQSLFSTGQPKSLQSLNCVPLDQRATKWRAQTEQIGEFQAKLLAQEADLSELKRALKAKMDEVSEMQIRRDLAEKKLTTERREREKLQEELERMAQEIKEKEAEQERTLLKYNQEINELYSDQRQMREKLKEQSKMGGSGLAKLSGTSTPSRGDMGNFSSLSLSPGNQSMSGYLTPMGVTLSSSPQSTLASTSTIGPSVAPSGDVAELQEQVSCLRMAMKRLAQRNTQLRLLLAKHDGDGGVETQAKPKWYQEALMRSRGQRSAECIKQEQLRELRAKLIAFKYEAQRVEIESSFALIPDTEEMAKSGRPDWSRSYGEYSRKARQQYQLRRMEMAAKLRMLQLEVENFIKTFDEGYSCDSTLTSFLAPHISKAIEAKPELVARITLPASSISCASSAIPLEVTLEELQQIQSTLLSY